MHKNAPSPILGTKELKNDREYDNDTGKMNTKDSSPEEQTESLLQSWYASIVLLMVYFLVAGQKI